MSKTYIKNDQGTTLIEMLVSLILISITALGGIAMFFNANELQAVVVHKKMAVEMANNQMEQCRRGVSCTAGSSDITVSGLNIQDGMTIQDNASVWAGYEEKVVNIGWNEAGPITRAFNVSFTTLVPQ